ncbi:unnamed protein product [Cyclocybe aegerita]|uniref:Uncharacterized protein n=1 Tax=Cyclocybe aegerita TaxID=1973307 RepID=A0A8S0WBC6_CYCAE|nr:unnamed protein product [Cyclocybe aegerita]
MIGRIMIRASSSPAKRITVSGLQLALFLNFDLIHVYAIRDHHLDTQERRPLAKALPRTPISAFVRTVIAIPLLALCRQHAPFACPYLSFSSPAPALRRTSSVSGSLPPTPSLAST